MVSLSLEDGTATVLNEPLVEDGSVRNFKLSPDGEYVVYVADQETAGVDELYSVSVDGGPTTKLNMPLPDRSELWPYIEISPDSSFVVFLADPNVLFFDDLFVTSITGGQIFQVSSRAHNLGSVDGAFSISPDSTHIVFKGDLRVDSLDELYVTAVEREGPSNQLGQLTTRVIDPVTAGHRSVDAFEVSNDSLRVVYRAYGLDSNSFDRILFSANLSDAQSIRLSGSYKEDVQVENFSVSGDGKTVVYRSYYPDPTDSNQSVETLLSIPAEGGKADELVDQQIPLSSLRAFKISPDSSRIVYIGRFRLFSEAYLYTTPFNTPPSIESDPQPFAVAGEAYRYTLSTRDTTLGDKQRFTLLDGPEWLNLIDFQDGTGLLVGVPTSAGSVDVTVQTTDINGLTATHTFSLEVTQGAEPDVAPVFSSTPITAVIEGDAYLYNIAVFDPNTAESITISATGLPSWLTLVDAKDGTATLSGTPTTANIGSHPVTLSAEDKAGLATTQSFTLEVTQMAEPDVAPLFSSVPITSVTQGERYLYNITVSDPNTAESITISATILPDWLTLVDAKDGTATLSGIPTAASIGSHTVSLSAQDKAGLSGTQTFAVIVEDAAIPDPTQTESFIFIPLLWE
ncbi:MAG: putative Ig domain-containing protein [Chloroflexota bacterium]